MNNLRKGSFAIVGFVALLCAGRADAGALEGTRYGDAAFAHLFETLPPAPPSVTPLPAIVWQDPTQPHPAPKHTGFQALSRGIGSDFKAFPLRKSTYVILAVGGAAAALAHPIDDDFNAHVRGSDAVANFFKPGKYLGNGWVQFGAAVGTYAVGRAMPKKDGKANKVAHMGFDLLRANILTQALTYGVKQTVRRDRPNGECCAFPSGHASATFAAASVLERHFGYRAAWPTFLIAGYVAMSRLHDDKHFLSDVLFGSALGMASGWTVVGRHGRSDYALMPVAKRGGVMIALVRQ